MDNNDQEETIHKMHFPYVAVEYFDDEFDDIIMQLKMKDFEAKLVQNGHTCTHIGSYYVGWCGGTVCTNSSVK